MSATFGFFTEKDAEDLADGLSKATGYMWAHDGFGVVRTQVASVIWEVQQGPTSVILEARSTTHIRRIKKYGRNNEFDGVDENSIQWGVTEIVNFSESLERILKNLPEWEKFVKKENPSWESPMFAKRIAFFRNPPEELF